MTHYEYDSDGWYIGWHEQEGRERSTPLQPPARADRARWNGTAWVDDTSREQAHTTAAARQAAIQRVQDLLDGTAQSWGYDTIYTACTYADEDADPAFQAEARALRRWRSQVWRACWQHAATATSIEHLLSLLPPVPVRPS
jgi:hypothetical protein